MAFFDRISKTVGRAAEQAKFEADKLVRVNKLTSEVSVLAKDVDSALASIGTKVIELIDAGQLALPDLSDAVAQVKTLQQQLQAKKAELDAAKAAKFEDVEAIAGAAEPAAREAAGPKFCPHCGAQLAENAKFCPSCGQKIG